MRTLRCLLFLALMACCVGCNHFKVTKHGCFSQAEAIATQVEMPIVLNGATLPKQLPAFVPYAYVHGDFHAGGPESQSDHLRHYVLKQGMRPDFLIYENGGQGYAGQVTQYVGYGAAFSQPVFRPQGAVHCCRIAPCRLGVKWDDKFMVTNIDEAQRSSGIIEGDTVISIDGKSVDPQGAFMSDYKMSFLGYAVDQEVKVIWIRPGTGRMEGNIKMIPNSPMPEGLESLTAIFDDR